MTVPGCAVVMVALLSTSEPLQAGAPSYALKTADESVTAAPPLLMAGCRVAVPEAGIIRSSGFRYHSDAGLVASVPLITSRVMLYGAKLCEAFRACELEAEIALEALEGRVYAV